MRVLNKIIPLISNFKSLTGGNMHTCAYCLIADRPYLFDAGNPGDATGQYAPELELNGIELKDIGAVFVTHAHGDHAGGAFELRKLGIPLMLPEEEILYLESMPDAFDHFFAPTFRVLGQEEFIPKLRLGDKLGYLCGPCKVDRGLKDDEVIELAKDVHIRVVPIPGHTDVYKRQVNIPVEAVNRVIKLCYFPAEGLRYRHGSVLSAGTADTYDYRSLSFFNIIWQQKRQKIRDLLYIFGRPRICEYIV